MNFKLNKEMLDMINSRGIEFKSNDDICEKCGCDKYVLKKQKTIFGTQTSIICKKCKNIIMRKL